MSRVPPSWHGRPRLSPEDVERYSALATSWGPRLLEVARSNEGFEYKGEKNGVQIYIGSSESQKIHLIKGITRARAASETIKRVFIAQDNEAFNHLFSVIDPMFKEGHVIDFFPHDYVFPALPCFGIKWARYSLPGGVLWDRDFLFLEHGSEFTDANGKQIGYGVGQSVELPEYGPLDGMVRGEIFTSGYVFEDVEPGVVQLTYIVQADPKGWIPAWASNLTGSEQAMNVARIRDWLHGLEDAKAKMAKDIAEKLGAPLVEAYIHDRTAARRGTITHTIRTKPGDVVKWIYFVTNGDIRFRVDGLKEGHHDTHVAADVGTIFGQGIAAGGSVSFHWDNSSSWLRTRRVYYCIQLPTGFAIGGGGGDAAKRDE